MGRQRQEHLVPRGSCLQGEVLHKRGEERGRYSEAKRGGEDMTDGWTGRGERGGGMEERKSQPGYWYVMLRISW